MTDVKSSREHVEHKLFIFIIVFPLFIYVFPTSVNDIFGFDMTGGFIGERKPVGAGYAAVFGAPIYIYYFVKTLRSYFGETPIHMTLSNVGVDIFQPNLLSLKWADISTIHFKDIDNERFLIFEANDKVVVKIKLKYLDESETKLKNLLEKYAGSIVVQYELR